MTTPAIERARAFSEGKLNELRTRIAAAVPPRTAIVACGSYARREASPASDFDYFTIAPPAGAAEPAGWQDALKRTVAEVVGVEPAKDGAFAAVERADLMARNIGGQHDDNLKLTRRMLFLLEGAVLSADDEAQRVRRAILERYLGADAEDGLALFLLDDVIRYYRTIAVDYEFKTSEGDRPKPWGLRNVKLMFSRKLIYASGVFGVAAACHPDRLARANRLQELLALAPVPRLQAICGLEATSALLESYDVFLGRLADRGLRAWLERLTPDDRDRPEFSRIRTEGQVFSAELVRLFRTTFPPDHPIHRAMLF